MIKLARLGFAVKHDDWDHFVRFKVRYLLGHHALFKLEVAVPLPNRVKHNAIVPALPRLDAGFVLAWFHG